MNENEEDRMKSHEPFFLCLPYSAFRLLLHPSSLILVVLFAVEVHHDPLVVNNSLKVDRTPP